MEEVWKTFNTFYRRKKQLRSNWHIRKHWNNPHTTLVVVKKNNVHQHE